MTVDEGSDEAPSRPGRTAPRPAAAPRRRAAPDATTARATRATKVTGARRAAAAGGTAARKAPASAARKAAAPVEPGRPATLAIDIGGTGLKASVLDVDGKLLADRVRVPTTYPCPPDLLVSRLVELVAPLPAYERVSAGFPGVVRGGKVLTAPHFVTKSGPGSAAVPKLVKAWRSYDLAGALAERLGAPVRVANDADLQGAAVVRGVGLEFVVTLGTGVGTALYLDGHVAPHLELAHHPFRKGQTYNEQIGEAALQRIGRKKWRGRVAEALANFAALLNYDTLYVGGGNSHLLAGHVDESVVLVDNLAGILGGIKLWDRSLP